MKENFELEIAVEEVKMKIEDFIDTYERLVELTTKDIEEAREKDIEFSEGMHKGRRMAYWMFIDDLKCLKRDMKAIEKAMA